MFLNVYYVLGMELNLLSMSQDYMTLSEVGHNL